jgi:UDP-N-acetylmuramoylalanine--D-glutamate ligase
MQCELAGRRVVVMGLGRFGGGAGAVRWLAGLGAELVLTDLASAESLAQPLLAIEDLVETGAVELRLGGHDEQDFRNVDLVVVSPAVPKPWNNRFIQVAVESGARLTTEIRILVDRLPNQSRIISVTGTAGKSTTTAMIAHILRELSPTHLEDARIWLGGNIGGSLLPRVSEISSDDWVVLELSSAQLYWLGDWFVGRQDEQGWSPNLAVVTNIMSNHLDWHETFEHYERCKRNITHFQSSEGRGRIGFSRTGCSCVHNKTMTDSGTAVSAVVGGDSTGETPIPPEAIIPQDMLMIPGQHNRLNAELAVDAVCEAFTSIGIAVDADVLLDAARSFTGLPHRLQLVAEAARDTGVIRAYNDSKSTTPEAVALAIQAFDEDPSVGADRVHLICGGYDKGVDLSPMYEPAATCRAVYAIGATGRAIAVAVEIKCSHVVECSDLSAAVEQAARAAKPGDVILLSTGCASWDQFTNYEERGRAFTTQIRQFLGLPAPDESLFQMPAEVGPEKKEPKKTRTDA